MLRIPLAVAVSLAIGVMTGVVACVAYSLWAVADALNAN